MLKHLRIGPITEPIDSQIYEMCSILQKSSIYNLCLIVWKQISWNNLELVTLKHKIIYLFRYLADINTKKVKQIFEKLESYTSRMRIR